MINKLILVGISIVIGISMIVVLVSLTDDIKDSLGTTTEILYGEDFNDGFIGIADYDVIHFLFSNTEYITNIKVGGIDNLDVESVSVNFNDLYIEFTTNELLTLKFNLIPSPEENTYYLGSYDHLYSDYYQDQSFVGDGTLYFVFNIPATSVLPTLIDLLPIIATLILITTAVIVIKKQN